MKMTFIAEHGVEAASTKVGKVDYEHAPEFIVAVLAEHAKQWGSDGASAGYEGIMAADLAKVVPFVTGQGKWVEYLRVPYGYLVLTK
jgi:hypothetical protein